MSTSSLVSLGSLRLQAQQRSDMENNNAVSVPEWNTYATGSYKELYDLLVSCYGNDYYVATTYQFQLTGGAQQYALPDGTSSFLNTSGGVAQKFYKLLGVDLQYSASPTGYVSLPRFEFIERNRYAYSNTATNFNGYTNLKYRIEGNNLFFIPIPTSGQTCQVWYVPAPTSLQFTLSTGTTVGSTTITLSDTTGLTSGMNVSGAGIQPNTTLSSVGSTSAVLSLPATATYVSSILSYWNDATTLEGISGWEDYVILDMAIKAQIKQENDFSGLAAQKAEMRVRIEAMAESRDIGQPMRTSDTMAISGDGFGWGNGGTYGGGYGGGLF